MSSLLPVMSWIDVVFHVALFQNQKLGPHHKFKRRRTWCQGSRQSCTGRQTESQGLAQAREGSRWLLQTARVRRRQKGRAFRFFCVTNVSEFVNHICNEINAHGLRTGITENEGVSTKLGGGARISVGTGDGGDGEREARGKGRARRRAFI